MASESAINAAITRIVSNYHVWTIGVTDSPTRRRGEHAYPSTWHHWNADTERVARNVEAFFIAKGMKGATGGGGKADYVYIFI